MNWQPYTTIGLLQIFRNGTVQTDACTNYATIDAIETQEFFLTGKRIQYSRRWAALMAGTNQNGNYVGTPPASDAGQTGAFPGIQKFGLVLESSWPQNDNMSLQEFYAPPDPETQARLLAEGQEWLKTHDVSEVYYGIPASQVEEKLQAAPLVAIIAATNPDHCVEVLNPTTMFDSEPHSSDPAHEFIAPLPPVHSYHQIILKMKNTMQLIRDNGTIFLVASDKSSKIGISNPDVLTIFFPTEPVTDQDTSAIPQIGDLADGVILHK